MIALSVFNTIEFYVITAFVAAAVLAFAAMPAQKSAVRTILVGGELVDAPDVASQAALVAIVNDLGQLELWRYGLSGVRSNGAYSLVVNISGFDVTIEERTVRGGGDERTIGHAVLDCFGAERYHISYHGADGSSAAFYLNIRPGNRIDRRLDC